MTAATFVIVFSRKGRKRRQAKRRGVMAAEISPWKTFWPARKPKRVAARPSEAPRRTRPAQAAFAYASKVADTGYRALPPQHPLIGAFSAANAAKAYRAKAVSRKMRLMDGAGMRRL